MVATSLVSGLVIFPTSLSSFNSNDIGILISPCGVPFTNTSQLPT
ncbi:hypothetical protein D0T08_01215 [Emticicia sp. C21]|nr:hypothetical protein D0T08_01215 [Emticicia sp. C21]